MQIFIDADVRDDERGADGRGEIFFYVTVAEAP